MKVSVVIGKKNIAKRLFGLIDHFMECASQPIEHIDDEIEIPDKEITEAAKDWLILCEEDNQ